MRLTPWDPWAELRRIREQSNRLLDQFLEKLARAGAQSHPMGFLPEMDFVESAHEYQIYLSLPGLVEEDMELTVGPESVVVRGQRQPFCDADPEQCRVSEWRHGSFERRIEFPRPVVPQSLRATYEDGVLTLLIAKEQ
jgi:HSP20 family protein